MKYAGKKNILCLLAVCIISGCGKETLPYPGDSINAYMYNCLESVNMPDFELNPKIEDLFMTAFKVGFASIELDFLREAMSEKGVLINPGCVEYLAIGSLSAVCQGDANLYIDEQLICTFTTSEVYGYSYMNLSNELARRIGDSIMRHTWSADSIRGKCLRVCFYMEEDDWYRGLAEKDLFKYMAIEVRITDD